MAETGRDYLCEGQVLALSDNPKKEAPRLYRICAYVGEGGSAVCYDAVREDDGKTGKLKEFFPAELPHGPGRPNIRLIRRQSGELIVADAAGSPAAGVSADSAVRAGSRASAVGAPSAAPAGSRASTPAVPGAVPGLRASAAGAASSASAGLAASPVSGVSAVPAAAAGSSPSASAVAAFDAMKAEYVQAVYLLNRTIAQADENQVLKNYIQDNEILYGGDTVYIWTAGAAGEGLDRYIARVRQNPQDEPDFRLHEILKIMLSLTDCMKALHTAGLMYLDLKPSNVLLCYDSEQHIDTSGVSLFDINTLYPADSRFPLPGGTPGFSAPEVFSAMEAAARRSSAGAAGQSPSARRQMGRAVLRVDNRADIYSLGAILYYAAVIPQNVPDEPAVIPHNILKNVSDVPEGNSLTRPPTGENADYAAAAPGNPADKAADSAASRAGGFRVPGGKYNPDMYDRLEELVRSSQLIAGTASGADEQLMELLVRILKKSLADRPADRYISAGEMLADLQKAELYSKQYAVKKSVIGHNRRLVLAEANEQGISSPDIVLRKLLAERPLYAALRGNPGKTDIRVLIVGAGEYARKFADICLETAQMDGINLDITMVCDSPSRAMAKYRETRPETGNFVCIDACSGEDGEEGCGKDSRKRRLPEKTAEELSAKAAKAAEAAAVTPGRTSEKQDTEAAAGRAAEKRYAAAADRPYGRSFYVQSAEVYGALHFCGRPDGAYDFVLVALGDSAENKAEAERLSREICGSRKMLCPDSYVVPVCYITGDIPNKKIGKSGPAREDGPTDGTVYEDSRAGGIVREDGPTGGTVYEDSRAGEAAREMGRSPVSGSAEFPGLYPVYINEVITPESIHPQLSQMAFNTHICWNSSLNLNREEEQKKFFADAYSYSASLASAVTIPYKLYSVGIDEAGPLEAARRFSAEILEKKDTDPEAAKKFQTLTALEHRRWVLHMAADGWRAPRGEDGRLDLRTCEISGKAKNTQDHTHACLVPSRADAPLGTDAWTANHFAKWDDPAAGLDALDALDRLSVELYRRLKKRADALGRTNPLESGDIKIIEKIAGQCSEAAKAAFVRYRFCLQNILNGAESYARQLDACEQELTGTVRCALTAEGEKMRELKFRLSLIRQKFAPAIEACMHTDYKAKDEVLIRKIPFILTDRDWPDLVLAFSGGGGTGKTDRASGRADDLFRNVASTTLLCPKRLHYLYYCDEQTDMAAAADALGRCLQYLQSRDIRTQVYLAAAVKTGTAADASAGVPGSKAAAAEFAACLQKKRLAGLRVFASTGAADAAEKLLSYVREIDAPLYDGSTALFASPAENAAFIRQLLAEPAGNAAGAKQQTAGPARACADEISVGEKTGGGLAYFEFVPEKKAFTHCIGCSGLQYVQDDSALRIRDMFALSGARDIRYAYPDFLEEQETLWGIYKADPAAWNGLCSLVGAYEENRRPLAEFPLRIAGTAGQTWAAAEHTTERNAADTTRATGQDEQSIAQAASETYAVNQRNAPDTAKNTEQENVRKAVETATAGNEREFLWTLPDFLAETAEKMVGELARHGVAGPKPEIARTSGGGVRVHLTAPGEYADMLEHLFAPGNLMRGLYGFRVYEREDFAGPCVCVSVNSLEAADLELGMAAMPGNGDVFGLLLRLKNGGYISGLRQNPMHPSQVSFSWSSEKVKTMLRSAAEILKLHTYDKVLKTGYFDDVLCNYRFRWENSAAEDTLDLVLTRGFRSVMISCIGLPGAKTNACHKLYSIADHFGIGTRKVIIRSFSREDDRRYFRNNEQQSARSEGLGILTISDPADIENIGEVLVNICS